MTTNVEKIVEQVKALPDKELDEFLSWLAEYELQHEDEWDEQIAKDFRPGGRLEAVLDRAHKDIVEGRVEPLDAIIDHS